MNNISKRGFASKIKPIKGYEGLYSVTDTGEVISHERKLKTCSNQFRFYRQTILKKSFSKNGRQYVGLSKDGQKITHSVDKLVAMAFDPNFTPEKAREAGKKSARARKVK